MFYFRLNKYRNVVKFAVKNQVDFYTVLRTKHLAFHAVYFMYLELVPTSKQYNSCYLRYYEYILQENYWYVVSSDCCYSKTKEV